MPSVDALFGGRMRRSLLLVACAAAVCAGAPTSASAQQVPFSAQPVIPLGGQASITRVVRFRPEQPRPDLLVGTQIPKYLASSGTGAGFAAPFTVNWPGVNPPGVNEFGDIDGDGLIDLVAGGENSVVAVRRNTGGGVFAAPVLTAIPAKTSVTAVDDFTGDGRDDVVAFPYDTGGGYLLASTGSGFGTPVQLGLPLNTGLGAAGDLDDDGDADLILAQFGGDLLVFYGNPAGVLRPGPPTDLPANSFDVELTDADGDGDLDAFTRNSSSMHVAMNRGDGTFTAPISTAMPSLAGEFGLGDIDGDGRVDVVVERFQNNALSYALGNGNGTFGAFLALSTPVADPYGPAVADIDLDGRNDLVFSSFQNDLAVLLNAGTTTLGASPAAFGSVPAGTASAPRVVTVTNSGGRAARIESVALQGANAVEFAIAEDRCTGEMLGAGRSCLMRVVFAPVVDAGSAVADLRATAIGGATVLAALSGSGLPAPADGATGPQGPAGPAGPTGATGGAGPTGQDGSDGADGVPGATGAQGPSGINGAAGAQGPAGRDGRNGRVTCKAGKVRRSKVKITCSVKYAATAARVRVLRNGRTIARGLAARQDERLVVTLNRRVARGDYELVLGKARLTIRLR